VNPFERLRGRRDVDRDLADELAAHLDERIEELLRAGLSREAARRQARRELGNATLLTERGRDVWRFAIIEDTWQDLRYARRQLSGAPAFTTTVILTIALGIGANTVIFGAINGLLIKTLTVADPGSLVRLRYAGQNQMAMSRNDYGASARDPSGREVRATFSYPMFLQLRQANRTMRELFAGAPLGTLNLVTDDGADVAETFASTGNFYSALGIQAVSGRMLVPDDDRPTAPPAAMISHPYWRARFGGRPEAVGTVIRLNNVPLTIVGVLPQGFAGVQEPAGRVADVCVPLSVVGMLLPKDAARLGAATYWWLEILGRLQPGASAEQVEGNLGGVFRSSARAGLDSYMSGLSAEEQALARNRNRTAVPDLIVDSASRGVYALSESVIRPLAIMGAAVGLVLLLVCANIANLLLSRSVVRQRELAVRLSLGASRSRLVRQLLTESLLLALAGGAVGLAMAFWTAPLLPEAARPAFAFDWRLWAFGFALATLTGLTCGAVPALRGSRAAVELKAAGRGIATSRSRVSQTLVVVQVAISLVLLIGAGVFVRTVANLGAVDPGFDPDSIVLFRVTPTPAHYAPAQLPMLYDRIADGVNRLPGVSAVGFSHNALLSGGRNVTTIYSEGQSYTVYRLIVSPQFFDTLRVPLLTGRGLSPRDDGSSPNVAVINRAAARAFFQISNPVGRRFGYSVEDDAALDIVGVVSDIKYDNLREPAPPTIYIPQAQSPTPTVTFEVRTVGTPTSVIAELSEAVRQVDANLPVTNVMTQANAIESRMATERALASTYSLFGALAAFVAAIGLFGLLSYSVARRTNEIGIRMALGARPGRVLRMVLGESMGMVALGIVIGLTTAAAAGRLVAGQLYGVAPTDPETALGASLLMLVVASTAGYFPARRAARVDPIVALKAE
jgi:predicted permease